MFREPAGDQARALKPIFVIGAPRSGTTLVGKILGQHPLIHSPGETHFFEDIWSRRQELGDLTTLPEITAAVARVMTLFGRYNFPETQKLVEHCVDPESLIKQTVEFQGGYGSLYAAFMMDLANHAGKVRVCDDTPKHLFYLPDILGFFPEAKFIGCVRDPRDFMFSYRNYWRRSTESERIKALYHPVMTSLLWRSSARLLLQYEQALDPARIMLVQYENLVENPDEEVRRMSKFLAVDFDDNMLAVETNNSSFEQRSTGIFSTSVDRWRDGLPPEDAWWCQAINQKPMTQLGLPKETIQVSKIRLLKTLMTTPLAFLNALKANEEKRGPLLPYLARRLRALMP